ncbi:hypothetical protein [Albidovulum sp.]|uniref:hypothetical protein n=1 Tax=Albidovulum sp. TaxID=1872424 RepID=UPI0039B9A1AE
MPDPLTNLEIQDVLSSIRRLVSEDNRHRAERESARDGGEAALLRSPAEAGKFVLTEALRVPGADAAEAGEGAAEDVAPTGAAAPEAAVPEVVAPEVAAPEVAAPEPVAPWAEAAQVEVRAAAPETAGAGEGDALDQTVTGEGRFEAGHAVPALAETETAGGNTWEAAGDTTEADAGSIEETIAELEAAVAGIGGEFEPDGSEVARGRAIDAELEEAFEDGFAVDLAAEEEEARALAQPVTSWTGPAAAADEASGPIEVVEPEAAEAAAGAGDDGALATEWTAEAAAESAPPAEPAEPEPEGAAEVDHSDLEAAARAPEVVLNGIPGEALPAFAHSAAAWRGATAAPSAAEAPRLGLRRLTLTAADAVVEGPAPWDRGDAPPADAPFDPDAAAMPDEAPGLASALADEAPECGPGEGEEESSIFGPGEDGVIDMDMLRDLVAEIIREELQGALGERITRNVRMLVRREINRALEARGLE